MSPQCHSAGQDDESVCLSPRRKAFPHADHVRGGDPGPHRDQEPPGQPAGDQVAARVAAGFGQEEEAQRRPRQAGRGRNNAETLLISISARVRLELLIAFFFFFFSPRCS